MNENKLLLNYHNAIIYSSDLSLFKSPDKWLNDTCIQFQMTRLQQIMQQQQKHAKNIAKNIHMKFLDPAVVSFLMHYCHDDSELIDFCKDVLLSLYCAGNEEYQHYHIFVPINDSYSYQSDSIQSNMGSHWSLLYLYVIVNTKGEEADSVPEPEVRVLHLDSSSERNLQVAMEVSQKLKNSIILTATLNEKASEKKKRKKNDDHYSITEKVGIPQQSNGYDCGVYVLAFVQAISSYFHHKGETLTTLNSWRRQSIEAIRNITDKEIQQLRKKIANDIRELCRDPAYSKIL